MFSYAVNILFRVNYNLSMEIIGSLEIKLTVLQNIILIPSKPR